MDGLKPVLFEGSDFFRSLLMRKILLLVNPLFAKHGGRDLPRVLGVFQQAGVQAEVLETGANRAAGDQARRAVVEGFDAVVGCGGDGTVFDVLQGLAGSDMPLGILPFGTGNVLAQNLKIPANPVAAAHWILSARPRPIPLGKITCCAPDGKRSWFFATAAGMGVHAALIASASPSKKRAAGRAAYYAAGVKLLFGHPQPFEAEITTLGGNVIRRHVCEAIALRVPELNFWRPGGGLGFPFLRLATVEGRSRWRLGRAAFDAAFRSAGMRDRRQSENAPARYEDALRVVLKPVPGLALKTPIAVQADGEVLGASNAVIEMAGVEANFLGHFS